MKHHHHPHHHARHYVPAAGHDWALGLYDPFIRLFRLDRLRKRVLEGAQLAPAQRVLDVGCGTGSLLCELKRRLPTLVVTGVDPDRKALARARQKAARAGAELRLEQGFAGALPFAAHSYDHVFSSFMFHHLEATEKLAMLGEVRRVLKPGAWLHLLDFRDEPAHENRFLRLLHSFSMEHKIVGQRESAVETLIADAGFVDVRLDVMRSWPFGAIARCHARTPS